MITEAMRKSILDTLLFKNISTQDDSAIEEFTKINEKRNDLIKNGIVKNKKLKDITKEEIIREIPNNWIWVRFNNILNFIDYRGKTPNKKNEGIRLIGSANIKNGKLDFTNEDKYITEAEYNNRKSRGITKKGDILFITEGGSMGNVCINDYDGDCSCGQRVITFQQYLDSSLNNKYYMYLLMSDYFKQILRKQSTGSAAIGIKGDKLKEIVLPFPPIKTQNEIVNKIDMILEKIDEITPIENELNEIKKEFSNDIKKSVISYLLKDKEDINKKKIKEVLKFENIKNQSLGKYNYLDVQYLRNRNNGKVIECGKFIEKNSLAILMDGENSGELFKMPEDGYLGSTLKMINLSDDVDEQYLIYYLELKKSYFKGNKRGAAIPHLNKTIFKESLIYLPSKPEQKRIVEKIEELLPLCNDINNLVSE